MRKGAASTARAVGEQASAIAEVSKETEMLTVQFTGLAKSMSDQSKSAAEITVAAKEFLQQTMEAAGAMKEQLKSVKYIRENTFSITKQIKLITAANVGNSKSAVTMLAKISGLQDLSRNNTNEVKSIRGVLEKNGATQIPAAR